ncbi:hypothetical protein ACHAW6_002108 [Cyclotella cf. meneghiniana]
MRNVWPSTGRNISTRTTQDIDTSRAIALQSSRNTNGIPFNSHSWSMTLEYNMWKGSQYIGIHFDWDCKKCEVHLSIPGYVKKVLKRFQH